MGKNIPPTQQYRIIHKTLGTRWIETYSTFIEYEGKPAIHSHFLDITPRNKQKPSIQPCLQFSNAVNTAQVWKPFTRPFIPVLARL